MKSILYGLVLATFIAGGFFFFGDERRVSQVAAPESIESSTVPSGAASEDIEGSVEPLPLIGQADVPMPRTASLIKDLPERKGTAKALYPVAPSAGSEWTPDLYAEATKEVVADARWSEIVRVNDVSAKDTVRIPAGVTLIYDASNAGEVGAIVVKGNLVFDPSVSTKLYAGTIFVLGEGKLSIKPRPGKTAEIVFKGALVREQDPAELLLGLVSVGGEVDIAGSEVPNPFVKVSANKGESVITTSISSGWKVGDEVFLSASGPSDADPTYWWFNARETARRRPFPEQWETAVISAVSGTSITIDKKLIYDHSGYIANLSRSVIIRSEVSAPVKSRGHVMFTGSTKVSVRNARLKDLGRTTVSSIDNTSFSGAESIAHYGANEEGRYALHVHHLFAPFTITGNVVDGSLIIRSFPGGSGERGIHGSPKWGIVNHDSSGLIARNVVVGAAGAGIVGEDGTETGAVEGNFVAGTGGGSGDNDDERFGATKGEDMGHGGFGFWFRGPFLNIRDNVAVGHFNQNAYLYFVHPDFTRNSLSNQAWIPADLRGKSKTDLISLESIREFRNNIASGHFGSEAFAAFYFQAPIAIESSTFEALGAGATGGVLLRHSKSLHISNSTLKGNGEGDAFVSSPQEGQITQLNNDVSGFGR